MQYRESLFIMIFILFLSNIINAQENISSTNLSNERGTATLPLSPGMATLTCYSGLGQNNGNVGVGLSDPNGYVMGIYDIREPICNDAPTAPANWDVATNGVYHDPSWIAANLGEIFGVEVPDRVTAPPIYVTSNGITLYLDTDLTMAAGGNGGDVFKIDGNSGTITKVISLPNTQYTTDTGFDRYVGLGNITVNNGLIYVTNLDDGLIYVVNEATGTIIDVFDHLPSIPDNPNRYFTQLERWAYGIKYNACEDRLYYSVRTTPYNTIYSVGLNANGSINDASVLLETVVGLNDNVVISDIEFSSSDCSQMLITERSIFTDSETLGIYGQSAHRSSAYNFVGSSTNWTLTIDYLVGTFGDDNNATGGSDFGYGNYGPCTGVDKCDDAVVILGDALDNGITPLGYYSPYGIQISDVNGNSVGFPQNSYFVDIDGNLYNDQFDKYQLGDLDVLSACELETVNLLCTGNIYYDSNSNSFAGIEITNNGNLASGSFVVSYYLSTDNNLSVGDTLITNMIINNIGVNESEQFTFYVNLFNLPEGDYYLLVVIDSYSDVSESNENDNICTHINAVTIACMDSNAHNYNPNAEIDSGNCETCYDSILNGDETEVDCGGTLCFPCQTQVCATIATGNDDAEQQVSSGLINISDNDIDMCYDSESGQYNIVGLRFRNLNIPQGAIITSAYLQFYSEENLSGLTMLNFSTEASDNAAAFTNTAYNISNRITNNSTITWVPLPWLIGQQGPDQKSPNLASIVQEVVSRPSFSNNNAIAFIISGTGDRTSYSFEGSPSTAQDTELCISFIEPVIETCLDDLFITNTINNGIYQADETIESDCFIETGQDVNFQAGECIELYNDFTVEDGAEFTIIVQGCDNP